MSPEPLRVEAAFKKICLEELEEFIVFEQPVELYQLGFELELSLGTNSKRFMGSYLSTIIKVAPDELGLLATESWLNRPFSHQKLSSRVFPLPVTSWL